ncbi:hypothetical protein Mapa_013414 [Marchantia paleacea]|nr:hypothetical protein Mapa_013414 [Marchantia paleacea]
MNETWSCDLSHHDHRHQASRYTSLPTLTLYLQIIRSCSLIELGPDIPYMWNIFHHLKVSIVKSILQEPQNDKMIMFKHLISKALLNVLRGRIKVFQIPIQTQNLLHVPGPFSLIECVHLLNSLNLSTPMWVHKFSIINM